MKRGEATPSRTPILRRLSSRGQLTRHFIPAILYRVSICTPFSTTGLNVPFYIRFASFVSTTYPTLSIQSFNVSSEIETRLHSFLFYIYIFIFKSIPFIVAFLPRFLERLFSNAARLIFSLLKSSCTCTPVVRIKRGGEGDGYIQTSRGCKFAWRTLSGDRG